MSDAPIVAVLADRINYRASGLGSCPRALLASRLGYEAKPPPKALQAAFDKGHELEPIILAKLVEQGWNLEPGSTQHYIELNIGTNHEGKQLYIVGHIDALGTEPGGTHFLPIDAKAFAQSTMDNFLAKGITAFPHYSWQQSAYAEGVGTNGFVLPLFNKDTGELKVQIYKSHPHSYDDLAAKVESIEALAESSTAIPDIKCSSDWGCPYSYLHDDRPVDTIPDEVAILVANYLIAKKKIDTYETARKSLAKLIEQKLPYDDDTRTFHKDDLSVTVVANARRLNTQKVLELLTEAELDINDYYNPGVGVHVVVKRKEDKTK